MRPRILVKHLRVYYAMIGSVSVLIASAYVILVLFSNLHYFVEDHADIAVAPRLFMLLVLLAGLVGATHPRRVIAFLGTPIFGVIVYMTVLYAINTARVLYLMEDVDSLSIDNAVNVMQRAILFPCAAFILYVQRKRVIDSLLLVAVLTVPVPVILSFFFDELSPAFNALRAGGTYINANQAAEGVLLWLIMVQTRVRGTLLLVLFGIAAVAVVVTFSRSGMLGLIVVWLVFVLRGSLPRLTLLAPVVLVLSYSTLLLLAENFLDTIVVGEGSVEALMERLSFLGALGSESAIADSSSESRLAIVSRVAAEAMDNPILGSGLDSHFAFGLASHNMVVDLWYTFGVFGIALYVWVAWLLYDAGRKQGLGLLNPYLIIYIWFSPFNHAHMSAMYWLIFYAYATHPELVLRRPAHGVSGRLRSRPGSGAGSRRRRRRPVPGV